MKDFRGRFTKQCILQSDTSEVEGKEAPSPFSQETSKTLESDWNNFTGTLEHSSSLQQPSGHPIKKKLLPKCWESLWHVYSPLPHPACFITVLVWRSSSPCSYCLLQIRRRASLVFVAYPGWGVLEGLVFALPRPQTREYFAWELQGDCRPADSGAKRLQVKTDTRTPKFLKTSRSDAL